MRRLLPPVLSLLFALSLNAQRLEVTGSRKAARTAGDVLLFAAPAAGIATTLALKDWQGLKQGALTAVTTVGTTYALKYLISKDRPDHSDDHSMPSMHTAITFTAATYIGRRYGWKWSIPAYAVSAYVAWSRVYGKSTTGGMWPRAPPSAPPRPWFSPVPGHVDHSSPCRQRHCPTALSDSTPQ